MSDGQRHAVLQVVLDLLADLDDDYDLEWVPVKDAGVGQSRDEYRLVQLPCEVDADPAGTAELLTGVVGMAAVAGPVQRLHRLRFLTAIITHALVLTVVVLLAAPWWVIGAAPLCAGTAAYAAVRGEFVDGVVNQSWSADAWKWAQEHGVVDRFVVALGGRRRGGDDACPVTHPA